VNPIKRVILYVDDRIYDITGHQVLNFAITSQVSGFYIVEIGLIASEITISYDEEPHHDPELPAGHQQIEGDDNMIYLGDGNGDM